MATKKTAEENVELEVVNAVGKKSGVHTVPPGFFAVRVSPGLLHQHVRWQRSKQQAGTHLAKTRTFVRGGGKKPWKQKGTGRARSGSNRSPLWVGGGVVHGPVVRSHEFFLNKKEKQLALRQAITARFREGRLMLVDDLNLKEIKTKQAAKVLRALGVEKGKKALVVLPAGDPVGEKSLRNLPWAHALTASALNVYDVLNAEYLIFVQSAFEAAEKRFVRQ